MANVPIEPTQPTSLSNRFNSLKASITGNAAQKQLLKNKRRVVPVAPPRLPSSANSSTAVTPNASNAGKMFLTSGGVCNSSFDDSQQDRLTISDTSDINNLTDSAISNQFDTSLMTLGEYRNNSRQRPPMSKLYSLQIDSEFSSNSGGGGGRASSSGYFDDTTIGSSTIGAENGNTSLESYSGKRFFWCFVLPWIRMLQEIHSQIYRIFLLFLHCMTSSSLFLACFFN